MAKSRNKNYTRWLKSSKSLPLRFTALLLRIGLFVSLAAFAVPAMIIILDVPMERNAAGKVVKGMLRTMASKVWEKRRAEKAKTVTLSRL